MGRPVFAMGSFYFLLLIQPVLAQEASQIEKPPPVTSVQIVNATSVPSISLGLNGENHYPDFPQGLYTADAPTARLNVRYLATDIGTHLAAEETIQYKADKNQTLLITGDFSTDCPPEKLPQPGEPKVMPPKPFKPNVQFRVLSHDFSPGEELRYRFINAMPHKVLKLWLEEKFLAELNPGDEYVLTGQPPTVKYLAKIDDMPMPLFIRQEGTARNATLIVFLRDDKPAFLRAFENTAAPIEKFRQMEQEAE